MSSYQYERKTGRLIKVMIKIYDKITSKDLFTENEEQKEYFAENIY